MNNYYCAKLEIICLQLQQEAQDDYYCSISLTKGIHQFGKTKFYVEKDTKIYYLPGSPIISFYFPPKMMNRKDVFFSLSFDDIESGDQFGCIKLSTNEISDKFSSDKDAVIDEKQQIFPGGILHYKIYLPKIKIYNNSQKLSLQPLKNVTRKSSNTEFDDILQSVFSRPDFSKTRKAPKQATKQPVQQVKQELKVKKEAIVKDKKTQLESSSKIPSVFSLLLGKRPQKLEQQKDKLQLNTLSKRSSLENSQESELANNMMASTISFLKQQNHKKHQLMPTFQHNQHQSKHLSLKLKTVIFLLIFGFLALAYDSMNDRVQVEQHKQQIIIESITEETEDISNSNHKTKNGKDTHAKGKSSEKKNKNKKAKKH